jgi:hypothetical protein
MLLSSHSPVVLSCLEESNIVFFDVVTVVDPIAKGLRRKTRVRSLGGNNTPSSDNGQQYLSRSEVDRYLSTVHEEG